MNSEAGRLLLYTEESLKGRAVHEEICGSDPDVPAIPPDDCPIMDTLKNGETHRVTEDVFVRGDGTRLAVAYITTPLFEGGKVTGSVVAFHDITELKHSREALERMGRIFERLARTDPLTGLANRLEFENALGREAARSKRHASPLSLVMLDIDHFNRLNERHGHHVADVILKELSELISSNLRREDMPARWDGAEFSILLPATTLGKGMELAERLRVLIEQRPFNSVMTITCSFGVAGFMPADDEDTLIKRADHALYIAKKNGRNRVEECDPDTGSDAAVLEAV